MSALAPVERERMDEQERRRARETSERRGEYRQKGENGEKWEGGQEESRGEQGGRASNVAWTRGNGRDFVLRSGRSSRNARPQDSSFPL